MVQKSDAGVGIGTLVGANAPTPPYGGGLRPPEHLFFLLGMGLGLKWCNYSHRVQKSDAGVGIGTLIGDRDYFAQK